MNMNARKGRMKKGGEVSMTKTVLTVLFGCLWMSFAFADEGGGKMKNDWSAPKVTPQVVLAQGFKQSTEPGHFRS